MGTSFHCTVVNRFRRHSPHPIDATEYGQQLSVHQSLAALRTAAAQQLAPALRRHPGAEPDLTNALNLGRLPSHLHSSVPLVL